MYRDGLLGFRSLTLIVSTDGWGYDASTDVHSVRNMAMNHKRPDNHAIVQNSKRRLSGIA
jgi:hypothetical protein